MMKRRLAALSVGLAAVAMTTLLGSGVANASWTRTDGAACRDSLFNNNLDVCGVTASVQRLPYGSVGWEAYNLLPNDATYISLWRYYGPGNAQFTGQSQLMNNTVTYYGWHMGLFQPGGCAQYLVGIGYWQGGTWHGTWQSPPVWSC